MPSDPIFIWDCGKGILDHVTGPNPVTFRTELTLVVNSFDNSERISLYPFDRYSTTVYVFAVDASTNDLIVVNIKSTTALVSASPSGLHIVTWWMITLMICLIMIATVFFGFRQRNEIIVVPIGTVFAFTQLQTSMPGAPEGFDFAGILPCLVLLSISSIAMIGMYLFDNPDNPSRKVLTWSEIHNTRILYQLGQRSKNIAEESASHLRVHISLPFLAQYTGSRVIVHRTLKVFCLADIASKKSASSIPTFLRIYTSLFRGSVTSSVIRIHVQEENEH
ncbi:hypothetical protein EDD18DRAFT_1333516 [Armillaria luteobubalina]|uniref:Uncharacterized protein n=1 Tax=Armillaria luteobubalina TaxID=153913 RepID=A0AA39Q1C2_9AGAR|nr:hypothetical protein EDD18DRAFT_1333516 [Armillaria luteobubalina]